MHCLCVFFPATTNSTPAPGSTGTVTEEHLRASLLSAVEDKMKRKLREFFAQAQAEMDVLKKTEADLTKGKEKLDKMVRDLEQEKVGFLGFLQCGMKEGRKMIDTPFYMQHNA